MKSVFYVTNVICGKLIAASSFSHPPSDNEENLIIYINDPNFFNVSKWTNYTPKGILISSNSIFSHIVSYFISKETPVAIVTNSEIANLWNTKIQYNKKTHIIPEITDKLSTKNGVPVELSATIKNWDNVRVANDNHVKNIGLICTEFFLEMANDNFESVYTSFQKICSCFPDGKISIRLYDYDKNKSKISLTNESFSRRGVRVYDNKQVKSIVETQIKCCKLLSEHFDIEVVIPFVTNVADLQRIKKQLDPLFDSMSICSMIETPAAYFSVQQFSSLVQQFSIGTNDLLQYFFAYDRDFVHDSENYIDPYTKALLSFLLLYPDELKNRTRICGQLPLYPFMLDVLISLGFTKFSIAAPAFPMISAKIRNIESKRIDTINEICNHSETDLQVKEYIFRTFHE